MNGTSGPASPAEVEERIERFASALRVSGFRLTHQRLEVLREIASTPVHPDADELFRRVRQRVPTISLDTVYRTIGTLADLGLVNRVPGVAGAARYDANTEEHHHFICTRCGGIQDIDRSALDEVRITGPVTELGQVSGIEVRFSGVCRACSGREGM